MKDELIATVELLCAQQKALYELMAAQAALTQLLCSDPEFERALLLETAKCREAVRPIVDQSLRLLDGILQQLKSGT